MWVWTAGNHCWCGTAADVSSAAVRAAVRPLAECEVSPCHANKDQMCGGVDRLLVYSFVCKPGDNATAVAQQVGRPPPTSYGAPNGTVWLPAEEDFTLQEKDSWFYNAQLGVRTPAELRTMCLLRGEYYTIIY